MANFLEDAKKFVGERQRLGKASAITATNGISDELTLIRAVFQEVLEELRSGNRSTLVEGE